MTSNNNSLYSICAGLVVFTVAFCSLANAQDLKLYLYKKTLNCIAANSVAYLASQKHDYVIIEPSKCPEIPPQTASIGNEFINLQEDLDNAPKEPSTIIVLTGQFVCIKELIKRISDRKNEELLHVNLNQCQILK